MFHFISEMSTDFVECLFLQLLISERNFHNKI